MEIGQLVPEKKILKDFYHIYMQAWWPCDLSHVTQIPRTPYPWRLYTKFDFKLIGKAVSEEKFKLVRRMTKLIQHLFGFEAKTLHQFLVIAYHLLSIKVISIRPRKTRIKPIFFKFVGEISMNRLGSRPKDSNYFQTSSGPASLLSRNLSEPCNKKLFFHM